MTYFAGKCNIWGKPAEYITAEYISGGEKKQNLLLTSGWWGLSRHFHYVPEIMASFFWCLPAWNSGYIIPYFYAFPYLTLLLLDRAYRDDARCSQKYGKHWAKYCEKVGFESRALRTASPCQKKRFSHPCGCFARPDVLLTGVIQFTPLML
jgi:7-dehydrocholesterol reductase